VRKELGSNRGPYYICYKYGDGMKRIVILFLGLLILLGGNCTKNPTGPRFLRGPYVYALNAPYPDGNSRIYYIDTKLDSVVDTLLVPYIDILGLGVSPRGDIIYLSAKNDPFDPPVFLEINTFTKQIVYQGQNSGVPTPDGKYLIGFTSTGQLKIFDSRTHREVFHSDTAIGSITVAFDKERGLAYAPVLSPGKIGIFNYRKLRWERIIDIADTGGFSIPILDLVIAPSLQKLYYTGPTRSPFFCVVDLTKDKVIQQLPINSGGYLAISKDNRFVYVTDPGGYIIEPPPTGNIGVYSTLDEAPAPSIDVKVVWDSNSIIPHPIAYTDQIAMAPDGSKVYLSTFTDNVILVVDIPSHQLRKISFGLSYITQLLVQP
jgi:DNA-binding beta-propeller fold protein YncE